MELYKKLTEIQSELKAPKKQWNEFGNYSYRSAEDIQEALKPLLLKHDVTLFITDSVELVGSRFYVKAEAVLIHGKDSLTVNAYAREPENVKGQGEAQITGATSSYARKYCLAGLFLLDDTKDSDGTNKHGVKTEQREPKPVQSKPIDEKGLAKLKLLKTLFSELPEATQLLTLDAYSIGKIEDLPVEKWEHAIQGLQKRKNGK